MGVRTTEQGPEGDKNHRAGPHYFHMRWPLGLLKAKGMLSHFQAFLSLKHRGISHVMSHHLGAESGRRFPKLPSSLERLRAPSSLHPPLAQGCANSLPPPAVVSQVNPNPLGGSGQASPGLGT